MDRRVVCISHATGAGGDDSLFGSLANNVIHGNNAPGTCNEVIKVNRADPNAYPRNIVIQGNVIYDKANAGGSNS